MQRKNFSLTNILICGIIIFGMTCMPFVSTKLAASETALEKYEQRYIVDMPTAGMLADLSYSVDLQLLAGGGFLFDFTAAFFKFMNLGLSYGGIGVIGHETMNLQKYPGVHLKFRPFNEDTIMPAIVLGFNSQGKGAYFYDEAYHEEFKAHQRHHQLAPDFYLAASKSFKWALGTFSVNAGLNYALQDADSRGINFYGGAEHSIYKYFALALEFNPNLNDKNEAIWKDGKSTMLNGALRFSPSEGTLFEIQFKDFLRNSRFSPEVGRYFSVGFISKFI